ncbi:MAG TPA: DUF2069 domain-containing protein [Stenotrophomonas sp.]|jgi:uncharacterized membrane protein
MKLAAHRVVLAVALLAMAAVYALLYHDDRHAMAAWLVFVIPPVLLSVAVAMPRSRRAAFWAGVLALFWFSHGVMAAWSAPGQRLLHLLEIALALLVIGAASAPGLRARQQARRSSP